MHCTHNRGRRAVIKQLRIEGLFDQNHRVVDIRFDEKITILYGKNGSGKTTILRIISALLSGRLVELSKISFKTIELEHDDNLRIKIDRQLKPPLATEKGKGFNTPVLNIQVFRLGEKPKVAHFDWSVDFGDVPDHYLRYIEQEFEEVTRLGFDEWMNSTTGDIMTSHEVIHLLSDRLPHIGEKIRKDKFDPSFLPTFKSKLIQTQRLLTFANSQKSQFRQSGKATPTYQNTVALYSENIKGIISKAVQELGVRSQKLDSTYPNRLLYNSNSIAFSDQDIARLMSEVASLRTELAEIELIGKTDEMLNVNPGAMRESDKKAIFLYLNDTKDKLSVFEELKNKIRLYLSAINNKFQGTEKKVSINRESGITFTLSNGKKIQPTLLSSGEQHEVVLLYDLIFQSERNGIILIDEPELSLHIDWQRDFVDEIDRIGDLTTQRFVIATHSPAIIGVRADLCREVP